MKAQVSTELLIIIGLILLIFIPLLALVYLKANEANQQIASYQAELAVFRVAYLANSIGSLGTASSITTDIYIPKNTKSFKVQKAGKASEVILSVETTPQGQSDIVEIIKYPVQEEREIVPVSSAGGWVRLKISSEYSSRTGEAKIKIEKI